ETAVLATDSILEVGGFIGYTTASERWEFRLWGKNLTDEESSDGAFLFGFLGGNIHYATAPRQYGISANYSF
ncbi:MAG: hypothetical protein ACR2PS_00290, partial [Pseudomonadales bacterium]